MRVFVVALVAVAPVVQASLSVRRQQGRQSTQSVRAKPTVDIFYESRCPDSLKFLNGTLREAYADKELWSAMDVKLHPFGNAKVYQSSTLSDGYHFWHPHSQYPKVMCQHGGVECLGNRIHACVMALHEKTEDHVPFVLCVASYGLTAGVELSSYACGQKLGINMDDVRTCADESKAQQMMLSIGDVTQTAHVAHVPWININGVHSKNDTLLQPVCDSITGHLPKSCDELVSTGKAKIHEETEHCGGSGGFLALHSEVKPCRRGVAKKAADVSVQSPSIEVPHGTPAGPQTLM